MEVTVVILVSVSILYLILKVLRNYNLRSLTLNKCESDFDEPGFQEKRKLLEDNFVVYKMLGEKGRKHFEKRVCRFIKMKTFRAGTTLAEITDEMRIMVAASAIQITYGYPEVYFNHFQTIILFADEYFSNATGQYHAGEVNAAGAIVLSWKNFKSGFSNLNDGRNLALHEMAHALRLTNIVDNNEYDFIDSSIMQSFEGIALQEMHKIRDGENPFFRSYGAVNLQEFFSVATECFFEQPHEFQAYNPQLYLLLTKILKMDLLDFGKE